jgi:tripartite-type tricarboxylate transporter receptor subunit TctC
VAKLNQEVTRILNLEDVKSRLRPLGSETIPSTPEYAATFIKAENAKWAKVLNETGIRLD